MVKYRGSSAFTCSSLRHRWPASCCGGAWMWLGFAVIYGGHDPGRRVPRRHTTRNPPTAASAAAELAAVLRAAGPARALRRDGMDGRVGRPARPRRLGAGEPRPRPVRAPRGDVALALAGRHPVGGITFAALGTNVGHELTHRTPTAAPWSPVAGCSLSRSMPSSPSSTSTGITVASPRRPIPRRRDAANTSMASCCARCSGRRSSAFELERNRLQTLGHGTWSLHNRYLRGWLMSALIVAAFGIGGRCGRRRHLRAVSACRPLGARGRQLFRALRAGRAILTSRSNRATPGIPTSA